jgi:hypothetical protein
VVEGVGEMKFESMNPKGYLDCEEYRPGGKLENGVSHYIHGVDHKEMCANCWFPRGYHDSDIDCDMNNDGRYTPTPLRGRGRPRKEIIGLYRAGRELIKDFPGSTRYTAPSRKWHKETEACYERCASDKCKYSDIPLYKSPCKECLDEEGHCYCEPKESKPPKDSEVVTRSEEQTYYYGYLNPLNERCDDMVGTTKGWAWFHVKHPELYTGPNIKGTADELFSDPSFELYTGPENPPEGWTEKCDKCGFSIYEFYVDENSYQTFRRCGNCDWNDLPDEGDE